jgi:hypothetical protein
VAHEHRPRHDILDRSSPWRVSGRRLRPIRRATRGVETAGFLLARRRDSGPALA